MVRQMPARGFLRKAKCLFGFHEWDSGEALEVPPFGVRAVPHAVICIYCGAGGEVRKEVRGLRHEGVIRQFETNATPWGEE